MAYPTPLTATQVDGQEKATMTDALFLTGPNRGKTLVVLIADANLAGAIAANEVMIQGGVTLT